MTSPRSAQERITYEMPAFEEEFCSPEGSEALRHGLHAWPDAPDGSFVGIRRELNYGKDRDTISPDFGVLVRSGDRIMETTFPAIPRDRRLAISDAVLMSAFGATSVFLHRKMREIAQDTLPRVYDFEMIYLRDALIIQAGLPIVYYQDHVRLIEALPLRKAAVAGYGTIVVPPRPESNHGEAMRWQSLKNAHAFYRTRMSKNEMSDDTVLLDPLAPTQIRSLS